MLMPRTYYTDFLKNICGEAKGIFSSAGMVTLILTIWNVSNKNLKIKELSKKTVLKGCLKPSFQKAQLKK